MDYENIILEALNERLESEFKSLGEAYVGLTPKEVFEEWLEYEGICGYADKILAVLGQLGLDVNEISD